jgi:hypothetical protein
MGPRLGIQECLQVSLSEGTCYSAGQSASWFLECYLGLLQRATSIPAVNANEVKQETAYRLVLCLWSWLYVSGIAK